MQVVDQVVPDLPAQLGLVLEAEGGHRGGIRQQHAAVVVDDPDGQRDAVQDGVERDLLTHAPDTTPAPQT